MKEVITISVGQCGLQLGVAFWKAMALEHGLTPSGEKDPNAPLPPSGFFYRDQDNRFVPRAVLVDLESRVLNKYRGHIDQYYNHDNVIDGTYYHKESDDDNPGGGAGNNWAQGYQKAPRVRNALGESILDIVDREVRLAEHVDGFIVIHSVAGGTGSGVGSWLIEQLREVYPMKVIQTISVLPQRGAGVSDTTVQPYNTVLTMKRLLKYSDAAMVLDNNKLQAIVSEKADSSDEHGIGNDIVVKALLAWTAPLRFPGSHCTSLPELVATLVVSPRLNLLVPALSPIRAKALRKSTVQNLMRQLTDRSHQLAPSADPRRTISHATIMLGGVGPTARAEARAAIAQQTAAAGPVGYVGWTVPSWPVVMPDSPGPMRGVYMTCTTGAADMLEALEADLRKLYRRGAFLNQYRGLLEFTETEVDGKGVLTVPEIDDAVHELELAVKEYRAARSSDYLSSL